MSRLVCVLACLVAWPTTACLDNKLDTTDVESKTEFIANTSSFASYADWMEFEHDVTSDHGGVLGTTTVYVSKLPDATTRKFPVGALLVKTTKTADSDALTIHAMSKRGGTFNATGAVGWEYFELLLSKQGTPYILWRGEKPPSGEQYKLLLGAEATPNTEGDCNGCHGAGQDGMLGDALTTLLSSH
jgi:hypothetical protein